LLRSREIVPIPFDISQSINPLFKKRKEIIMRETVLTQKKDGELVIGEFVLKLAVKKR
jgi:hypothetical protein